MLVLFVFLAITFGLLALGLGIETYRSGNGGYVEISIDGGSTWTVVYLAVWELTEAVKSTENTHSGTGGNTNYEKVVNDNQWRLQIPWDEDQTQGILGVYKGSKIGIRFKHGSGAVKKTLLRTLVENYKTICDNQGDIVRIEADGKGGVLS